MIKNKDGFSFVETIVMCAILMVGLLFVYKSYTSSINVQKFRLENDGVAEQYKLIKIKEYLVERNDWKCESMTSCERFSNWFSISSGFVPKTCSKETCMDNYCQKHDGNNGLVELIRCKKGNGEWGSKASSYCDGIVKSCEIENENNRKNKKNYKEVIIDNMSKYELKHLYFMKCSNKNFSDFNNEQRKYMNSMNNCSNGRQYRLIGEFLDEKTNNYSYAWIQFPAS